MDHRGWYTSGTNVTRYNTVTRDHLNGFPAALCAGVAIWCSLGTIGLVGAAPASVRVALLAPWWLLPVAIVAVFGAIRVLRLSPREQSPLFGSAVIMLPWLPFPIRHVDGAPPLTAETAELNLARHASGLRSLAYDFTTRRVERTDALLATMRIGTDGQRRPVTSPTIFAARDVPAGAYGLHVVSRQPTEGRLIVRAGSTPLPLLTVPAKAPENAEAAMILLPTDVRLLTVDVDATTARAGPAVEIIRLGPPAAASAVHAGSAHWAAHYETADVFFLDEHAYPEPTGFWVAGGRATEVILANGGDARDLFVRNVPVDNHVTIDVDGDVQELMLAPGEERLIRLQNAPDRRPHRVRLGSQSGFRPSTIEAGSSDLRYLGLWIEVR